MRRKAHHCLKGIYRIQHIETGNCYINKACDLLKKQENFRNFKTGNPVLWADMMKYGSDAFTFTILATAKYEYNLDELLKIYVDRHAGLTVYNKKKRAPAKAPKKARKMNLATVVKLLQAK